MSVHDEYRIVINEAQRGLIMRALTNAITNDRRKPRAGAHCQYLDDLWSSCGSVRSVNAQ